LQNAKARRNTVSYDVEITKKTLLVQFLGGKRKKLDDSFWSGKTSADISKRNGQRFEKTLA